MSFRVGLGYISTLTFSVSKLEKAVGRLPVFAYPTKHDVASPLPCAVRAPCFEGLAYSGILPPNPNIILDEL